MRFWLFIKNQFLLYRPISIIIMVVNLFFELINFSPGRSLYEFLGEKAFIVFDLGKPVVIVSIAIGIVSLYLYGAFKKGNRGILVPFIFNLILWSVIDFFWHFVGSVYGILVFPFLSMLIFNFIIVDIAKRYELKGAMCNPGSHSLLVTATTSIYMGFIPFAAIYYL